MDGPPPTPLPTPLPSPLPARRTDLRATGSMQPWAPQHPTFAAVADGLSVVVAHLEPAALRAVRRSLPELGARDAATAQRAAEWVRQEAGHQREHRRHRDALVEVCPRLTTVERATEALVRWCGRRPQRTQLAAVVGFEAMAYAVARWVAPRIGTLFVDADPEVATLVLWHLAEEVEHKAVAHDVHEALGGRSWERLAGGLAVLAAVGPLTVAAALVRLAQQRRLRRLSTWWCLARDAVGFALTALTTVVVGVAPGHHPDQLADPAWYAQFLRGADAAGGVEPWEPPRSPAAPVAQLRPSSASNGPVTS